MDWLEALILGLLQGLTEFLPVSSSGHLELGKALFGIHSAESMTFTIVVHAATVLSIIVVFRKDIAKLIKSFFSFKDNEDNRYTLKILVSAVPVVILGLLYADQLEQLFTGNVLFVGLMLLITAGLLAATYFAKDGIRKITFLDAIIIGIAQAVAVLPGISRSGATISTALLLGNKKDEAARFSFLMVIIPVLGAVAKDIYDKYISSSAEVALNSTDEHIGAFTLAVGFIASFISGVLACSLMLKIVKSSKLIYFAIYCLLIALIAIGYSLFF
ncbi:MAG: undecaprenyl-diphosphate phosphatase [Bacteroidales bacterium]|nr:undecaprenyl-diphosphate phosphatase [Bacteroidales bacterium]